ncbi:MAG: tetratricopeptide repeat protein [Candidatus Omnitrophica bacterium]|nr:tetratricopeptide repeat protein [Candidatus Omnitrophota bacterium]
MKRIFFILVFLGLLKGDVFGADSLLLKEAEKYYKQGEKELIIGNLEEAKKYFQKSVAINPNFTDAYYQLAKIAEAKGCLEQAEEAYQKAGYYKVSALSNQPPTTSLPKKEEIKPVRKEVVTPERASSCTECERWQMIKEAKAWEKELIQEEKEFLPSSEPTTLKEIGALEGVYTGIVQRDLYKAQRKGPAIASELDPYHPKHKDFKIPYYRDREGLKITPVIGIRGEYNTERQLVPIENLIMEAQEFDQRSAEEAKRYISLNRKRWHQEEIVLHYKETWPKFTYTYMEERATREYEPKLLWSNNKVFYDHYNRRYYKLEHTIPCLPKLGALKWVLRYGDHVGYRPNDNATYLSFNSYLVGIETWPYIAFLDKTVGVKIDYQYNEGEYKRAMAEGWDERKYKENQYWLELDFYYPEKFLRIKPHFYYGRERHYPSYNTWWKRENGIKIEKDLNGMLRFVSDWTYIDYTRTKDPYGTLSSNVTTSAWRWDNNLEYEFIRDLKLKLGADYGNGLSFDAFDYYTLRAELQWKKPGLNDFRIGYGHTNYFELDESVDTFLFKFGLFI